MSHKDLTEGGVYCLLFMILWVGIFTFTSATLLGSAVVSGLVVLFGKGLLLLLEVIFD